VNATDPSAATPSKPRRNWVTLLLKLLAVAAAGSAQAYVAEQPWYSVAGFALGAVLFLVAERRAPVPPEPPQQDAPPAAPGYWTLFAVGCALCIAAGILVYRSAVPSVTHPPWVLGLLCFGGCTLWSWQRSRRRRRPSRRMLASMVLLVVLAGGFFAWHVSSIPPEVHGDEGEEGMDAVRLLTEKPFNLFTVGWYWLPHLHVLRQAVGIKVFGVNLLGLRSTSVVVGTIGVLLVFSVGTQLWGFEVGLLAALVLVSARFFIHLSRTGLEYLDTPVLSILVVWLAWWTWYELRLDAVMVCGLALGLGVQSYYASRLVPVLLTVTWLLWLVRSDRRLRLARFNRLVLIAVVALVTAAPMIGYFFRHPSDLWMRTLETSALSQSGINHLSYGYGTRNLRHILLIQLQHAVTLFNYQSDSSLQYGYRPGGLFEPVTAILFVLGFAGVCAHPLRRRNLLLLLWIAVPVIVGGALTIDTPFYPRISGVLAFAALVVALALHSLLTSLRATLPRRAARVVVPAVALGVVAVVFANNIQDYFFEYAPHHRLWPGLEISAWIRANGTGKTTYMVGGKGVFIKHGTIRFLTYGFATEDVLDLNAYLRNNRFKRDTSVFIIMPQGKELIPQLQAAVGPLDIEPHRWLDNPTAFYTAVPLAEHEPGHAAASGP
jgi:4-amino-4-deoxy-L-arabinose transferase-like glycosyltransferase